MPSIIRSPDPEAVIQVRTRESLKARLIRAAEFISAVEAGYVSQNEMGERCIEAQLSMTLELVGLPDFPAESDDPAAFKAAVDKVRKRLAAK